MTSVEQTIPVARSFPARPARPRGWLIRRALLGADIFSLILAFSVTEAIFGGVTRSQALHTSDEVAIFLITLPVWVLLAKLYGLYDRDEARTDHRTTDDLAGVFHLITVGTWLVVAGARFTGLAYPVVSRVTVFWGLALISIVTTRTLARAFCRRQESYFQDTIVVGTGREGRLVARRLEQNPEFGLRVIGFVGPDSGGAVPGFDDLRVIGPLADLPRLVQERHVDRVVMGFTEDGHVEMLKQIRELNACGVQVDIMPRFPELMGPEVDVHSAGGISLWSLRPFQLSRSSRMLKRMSDLAVASVGLLLLAPFFALAAIAIKLDSRGPVFFRQERVLDSRRTFRIWKFRTMVADAEEQKAALEHLNAHALRGGDGKMFKIGDDPRITRVGKVLRRHSLDELPQLINVLVGEMSLVGPRPLIPEEHRHVTEWRRRRLELKPGVTGLWQVNGRSNVAFEEMVELDYRYVTNWTPWLDLSLLLRTFSVVVRGGAEAA